jgi:DNA adenine methylase Dam
MEKIEYPFLYPGRKQWDGEVVRILRKLYQDTRAKNPEVVWVEPFLGGGGSALGVSPTQAILSDACLDLVAMWRIIQQGVEVDSSLLVNEREFFYARREDYRKMAVRLYAGEEFTKAESMQFATLFHYLCATCFRGVFRTSKKSGVNSPYGQRPKCSYKTTEEFAIFKPIMKDWQISHCDFRQVKVPSSEAIVYADPPYAGKETPPTELTQKTPGKRTNNSLYGAQFGPGDRMELIEWLAQFPVAVASDDPVDWVIQAYEKAGFKTAIIGSKRGLATAKGKIVPELLAYKGFELE